MRLTVLCAAATIGLTGLAACAGDGGDRPAEASRGPPRPLPNVFISPAGEPFRAATGTPYPVAAWFAHADADHDGKLTRAEFDADALRFFHTLDTNHDGVVDGVEVGDYERNVAPEILPQVESLHEGEGMDARLGFDDPNNTDNRRSDGRDRKSGLSGGQPARPPRSIGVQGAAIYSMLNAPEPVSAADTSFDGRITEAEFLAAADRRFDRLDKLAKGYLTLSGLPATPIQQAILKQEKARHKGAAANTPR